VQGGLNTLERLVSPVFLSTDPATGRVVHGLGPLPLDTAHRPVLLVGNHQLFAPDMPLMVARFLKERGVLVRGLAHPFALQRMSRSGGQEQGESGARRGPTDGNPLGGVMDAGGGGASPFGSFLESFGAVPVGGFNMHKLLGGGEVVLLYPGGAREAFKNKDEKYKLLWPERAEFVRMAARFGATIIPFAAVGAEDGVNQVLDGRDLAALPFIGDRIRKRCVGTAAQVGVVVVVPDATPTCSCCSACEMP
jgi:hypothetical protein